MPNSLFFFYFPPTEVATCSPQLPIFRCAGTVNVPRDIILRTDVMQLTLEAACV